MSGEPPEHRELAAPAGRSGAAAEAGEADRIERLERENAALRRANARLMRERLGSSDTAAASRLAAAGRGRAPSTRLVATIRAPLARLRLVLRRFALRVLR